MLQCGEFAAWVSIDGTEAQEYGLEVSDDQKSVTCWIASELGKKFSVHWTNTSYDCDTQGKVYVDGNDSGGLVLLARKLPATATKLGATDTISVKPFVFSSLELTDDDAFLGGPSYQQLGLIELRIHEIKDAKKELNSTTKFLTSLSEIKVHERSKKAITQQITLAERELLSKPLATLSYRLGAELAKFSFKYRPADVLRANGIIPASQQLKRKASAEPLRSPSPEYDQADAERAKVLRDELAALEAKRLKTEKKPRVKDDPDILDLTQDRKKKVKKVKKESKPTFIQGEIIDLT
ncbi:hypothetical protein C8R45DRAFT_980349 [Mycena sanguinolenta]|nr:hypothetical protein C8R45DRAFT_980349 [Mycena sanguinolenta]